MIKSLLIVERLSHFPKEWTTQHNDVEIVDAQTFLNSSYLEKLHEHGEYRVINLCRKFHYLSAGYYSSLLAGSRSLSVVPTAKTIMDLHDHRHYESFLPGFNAILRRSLKRFSNIPSTEFTLLVCFGLSENPLFNDLAKRVYEKLAAPILKLHIHRKKDFEIKTLSFGDIHHLNENEMTFFLDALGQNTQKRWRKQKDPSPTRFSLAILVNEKDSLPPSNPRALKKFQTLGQKLNIDTQLIQKKDYSKLLEFDALFIRETTRLTDHTYRFALKAQQEGMPVIDDPVSILRCTNKIFCHELFASNKIPTLPTRIFSKATMDVLMAEITYPVVIKIPDGNFSKGISKANNPEEFVAICSQLFKTTELLIAQSFVKTDFDWRIGVLAGKPLFVCRYWMVKNHWQIYKTNAKGAFQGGNADCLPLEKVDPKLLNLAVKSANLIGDGLYGVDIKETEKGYAVMEVNDNPNIDHGVEDLVYKDQIYIQILKAFQDRVLSKWDSK